VHKQKDARPEVRTYKRNSKKIEPNISFWQIPYITRSWKKAHLPLIRQQNIASLQDIAMLRQNLRLKNLQNNTQL